MLDFDLNKQMFDYQNAYNTPKAQMQRLKDAGLNPALMYGQGTTGNAQGYPQIQTAFTAYFGTKIASEIMRAIPFKGKSTTNFIRRATIRGGK